MDLIVADFFDFFLKMLFHKTALITSKGVYLFGEYNTYCFGRTVQKQLPKQKYLPNIVPEIISSKKISQTSHKVIFDKTPSQVFSYELCKVLENTPEELLSRNS